MNPGGIKDHGGAAFPLHSEIRPSMDKDWCGMTLRDYFAAKAMQAYIGTYPCQSDPDAMLQVEPYDIAYDAYKMADAMLAERSKA